MSATDEVWEPLDLRAVVDLFSGAPFRWWISGGLALELHTGRSWRDHDDTDVGVVRSEAAAVATLLADWDLHVAADGTLTPWDGSALRADAHQNNVWARPGPGDPWMVDLTVSDGDDTEWVFRRDPTVRRRWERTVLIEPSTRLPYLAPDLQLLFKSKAPREKDHADAREVIPVLDADARNFLLATLPQEHVWRRDLAGDGS